MPDAPRLVVRGFKVPQAKAPLPSVLQPAARSGEVTLDPLLETVTVTEEFELRLPTRDGAAAATTPEGVKSTQLLALEAEDGTTIFTRADHLAEVIARVRPEALSADGEVDLSLFTDPNAANRGLPEWLWRKLKLLTLDSDGLIELAKQKFMDWATDKAEQVAFDVASYLGTKALMAAIESRLAGEDGLYQWGGVTKLGPKDRLGADDPRLREAVARGRMLVLIHGTASSTEGSFKALTEDKAAWAALLTKFPGGIYGFEHRTFSKSPGENAFELLSCLPNGAQVSLVTHSRGGLIGDLLCLDGNTALEGWKRRLWPQENEELDKAAAEKLRAEVKRADDDELARIQRLLALRRTKVLSIERYVRVACPAGGTQLLSENLDVYLSGFLTLLQRAGGAAASALATPVAGTATSSVLGVFKRIVLEIANNRLDPRLVPGIAAMSVGAPLSVFLTDEQTKRDKVSMAVISGDTEFEGLGIDAIPRRIANLFLEWAIFKNDNDLVVDTDSMYLGLAARLGTQYLYDQGPDVDHFQYFRNPLTRDALRRFLTIDEGGQVVEFRPLVAAQKPWLERLLSAKRAADPQQPVVFVLPGIMGSYLARKHSTSGDLQRLWVKMAALGFGGIGKLKLDLEVGDEHKVIAEDLFESFYGDLVEFLSASHQVIKFPYDWRRDIPSQAIELRKSIREVLNSQPARPVRILAHSMGGLVARAAFSGEPELWDRIVERGGRFVMLGTPNHGSYELMHALLGKTSLTRKLAMVDVTLSLQEILEVIGGFPGALSLLPDPHFEDVVVSNHPDLYDPKTWEALREANRDRWFGDRRGATPTEANLKLAKGFWTGFKEEQLRHPERISYVFGQGKDTPCGYRLPANAKAKPELLATNQGDGTVTWESGRLKGLPEGAYWYMPVEHGKLPSERSYFPALFDLITVGNTSKLDRLRETRGTASASILVARDAPPPVFPSEDELVQGIFGEVSARAPSDAAIRRLEVCVHAADLRSLNELVLCGHYRGDTIAGAEAALDAELGGRLSERERLGLYADEIGTSCLVVMPSGPEDKRRGTRSGAVVVGLGDLSGQLSTNKLTETVRAAVLRLLMLVRDTCSAEAGERQIKLSSLLLGWNSSPALTIADSVAAVTLGVAEANRRFADAIDASDGKPVAVSKLTFVEMYLDAAITATRALAELPERLSTDLKRTRTQLDIRRELIQGEDSRQRLSVADGGGYWPRLVVTDAERSEDDGACPPECYVERTVSRFPRDVRMKLCKHEEPCDCENAKANGKGEDSGGGGTTTVASPRGPNLPYLPQRLKYVFSSQRARAESIVLQRQPGLIEAIMSKQVGTVQYDSELGRLLFELMVPLEFKSAARDQQNLALVVDEYSACLPWEMIEADGEPMVLRTAMVRQLATTKFRGVVRTAARNAVCIIADPSHAGFELEFGGRALPALSGAAREGQEIHDIFAGKQPLASAVNEGEGIRAVFERQWATPEITYVRPGTSALSVLARLYERPYRVLTIAGHGVFEARARDGSLRTGVVLSDGILLTAAEIQQMVVVPEVVFLNCCHLAKVGPTEKRLLNSAPNKWAGSIAREMIEMGVRCVIAAGWAVDDLAATTFASELFQAMVERNEPFGSAVRTARLATFEKHRMTNTWGAYQAYGDPNYRLRALGPDDVPQSRRLCSPDELIDAIHNERRLLKTRARIGAARRGLPEIEAWLSALQANCPADWAQRPEVRQALARLFAELGDAGFERARSQYLAAIAAEDANFQVAIKSIEQLSNLEARAGEKIATRAANGGAEPNPAEYERGIKLIESAIKRMKALLELTTPSASVDDQLALNAERWAILGSAYKRKAAVKAIWGQPAGSVGASLWDTVKPELEKACKAYANGHMLGLEVIPYLALNYVQLKFLLADPAKPDSEQLSALLAQASAESERRYAKTGTFFDAVGAVDGALTQALFDLKHKLSARELADRYRSTFEKLPIAARQSDSVLSQLRFLKLLLEVRAAAGYEDQIKLLADLVRELS